MSQSSLFPAPDDHDPGGKVRLKVPAHWHSEVEFSPCKRYRYKLLRRWAPGPLLLGAFMNPSEATLEVTDPTVAKVCRMAERMKFGGLYIANCCAYRATDKMRLLEVEDPVGERNHAAILEMARECSQIVVGHGQLPGGLQTHGDKMANLLLNAGYDLYAFKISKTNGAPWHPLYLREDTLPVLWKKANCV